MEGQLEIIIIPTVTSLVVLPAAMVRQVLPYAPVIPGTNHLNYVRGTLIVQQYKLNVIDMSVLIDPNVRQVAGESGEKLVWFSSLQTSAALPGYVLQASDTPFFMACHSTDITEKDAGKHPLIAYHVEVNGLNNPNDLPVFVPDLINLEIELTG